MKPKLSIGAVILVVAGCVGSPQIVRGDSNTLAVGQLDYQVTENLSNWKGTANGDRMSDVVITFRNDSTGKTIKVSSQAPNGFFLLSNAPEGSYTLEGIDYKLKMFFGGNPLDEYFRIDPKFRFALTSNQPIDFGRLLVKKIAPSFAGPISFTGGYNKVKAEYQNLYPDSDWNTVVWFSIGAEGVATAMASPPGQQTTSQAFQAIEFGDKSFDDIYPVFRTYYATHPLGKIVLHNTSNSALSNLKVTLQIKEFMSDPTDCNAPSQLGPGESRSIDLFGLFLPSILETTEKTKTQADIDVAYTLDGQTQHQSLVAVVPVLDRNATTWVDDRRAAAFVTTKDPAVLSFSKNVSSIVKGKVAGEINPNLLTSIALFEALQLFGLTYSQDPIPTVTSGNQVADYIQFPRQTLEYKGGKCSDFSVLYTALLESVGVEAAFITTPGHIFIAFSTDLSPDEARKDFSRPDDLIMSGGKSWIPVEVTETAGFLRAWQDGAREWRENTSKQQAAFYPLQDAWKLYEPVGVPGTELALSLPKAEKVVERYQEDVSKFIDQQIFSQVVALEKEIEKTPDPRKPTNSLGVLYAKYGQYNRARREFERLVSQEEYVPALLNLGNIFYLSDQKEKALEYYNRAQAKEPDNFNVLLAVARVNHDLENYGLAEKFFSKLKDRNPDLAAKFAYLDLKGEEATRASDLSGLNGTVVWDE